MEGGGCYTFGPPTVTLFDRRLQFGLGFTWRRWENTYGSYFWKMVKRYITLFQIDALKREHYEISL
jgi:hypothetical protein